jgi:uncharacterized protein
VRRLTNISDAEKHGPCHSEERQRRRISPSIRSRRRVKLIGEILRYAQDDKTSQISFLAILVVFAVTISGCLSSFTTPQPDRTRYYTLTVKVEADAGNVTLEDVSLGVGPVRIPGYLDRDQLVTRLSENRFDVSENDRWIEPLDNSVGRVLAQDIYGQLKSDRIFTYPFPSGRFITHQIEIDILRFEATAANEAHLAARWTVVETATKQMLASKTTFVKRPIQGATKEAAVDALSLTVADFSREIANTVRTVAQKKKS